MMKNGNLPVNQDNSIYVYWHYIVIIVCLTIKKLILIYYNKDMIHVREWNKSFLLPVKLATAVQNQ